MLGLVVGGMLMLLRLSIMPVALYLCGIVPAHAAIKQFIVSHDACAAICSKAELTLLDGDDKDLFNRCSVANMCFASGAVPAEASVLVPYSAGGDTNKHGAMVEFHENGAQIFKSPF